MAAGAACSPHRKMPSIRQPRSPHCCNQTLSLGTSRGNEPDSAAASTGKTPATLCTTDHTSHNMAEANRAASTWPRKHARRVLTRPGIGGLAKTQTGIPVTSSHNWKLLTSPCLKLTNACCRYYRSKHSWVSLAIEMATPHLRPCLARGPLPRQPTIAIPVQVAAELRSWPPQLDPAPAVQPKQWSPS